MSDVLAATLVAPGALELRSYPYPEQLEPGAVLLQDRELQGCEPQAQPGTASRQHK